MSEMQDPTHRPQEPGQYAIRVSGHLDQRWAEWFDGLTLSHQVDGTTVLHGRVADQASLHGLLLKIRDLGLPLLSVTPLVPDGTPDQPDATTSTPTPGSTP